MAGEALLVLSTFPDVATARRIGRQLVEERCAACANILPPVESIYWWEEKVESANETLVLFKTSADRYNALETTLRGNHFVSGRARAAGLSEVADQKLRPVAGVADPGSV